MKLVGDGVCIHPTSENIFSPITGFITMIYSTKHAIGLRSEQGDEILIHLGFNTSRLDGKHMKIYCEIGSYVEKGDLIACYDYSKIENEFDTTVCMVVTNLSEGDILNKIIDQDIIAGGRVMFKKQGDTNEI